MHTLFFRTIGIAFATWMSSNCTVIGQEWDLVSLATGVQGLRTVAQNSHVQKQFEISDVQVGLLRQILENESIEAEYVKAYHQSLRGQANNLKNGVRDVPGRRKAIRLWDDFVRTKVGSILTKTQLDQIRVHYLRKEFLVPSLAFAPQSLPKFDLNAVEIKAIEKATNELIDQLHQQRQVFAKQTIESLKDELTQSQYDRLEQLVGNRLSRSKSTYPDAFTLEISGSSQPFQQLLAALTLAVPGDHKIEQDKFVELRKLLDQVMARQAKQTFDEKELRDQLISALSNEQRVSLIREIHWKLVFTDVTWLAKPEVLKFIQLELEDRKNLDKYLQDRQSQIQQAVDQAEIRIYKAALGALSDSKQSEMRILLDGVFTLKLN